MDGKKAETNLRPIAVLIDELKHEDVSLRINAIRRLSTIALALGFERTREELMPFLQSSVDEEDEVLVVLAEELGRFVEFVGGAKYGHVLFGPLEQLAAVEETLVREKAAESISAIAQLISPQQCEEHLVPVIKRLASGEWFTRKISAAQIIPACYSRVSAAFQSELRQAFSQLTQDDSPMVRRASATSLAKLIPVVGKAESFADVIPQIQLLSQDEQDSVRLLSVELIIAAGDKMSHEEKRHHILPQLRMLWGDKSWRVRFMVGEKIVGIARVLGAEIVNEEVISAYAQLLRDHEAEVRDVACSQLPRFSESIPIEAVKKSILPCLANLVSDSSQHVRASLAGQISGLSPLLGKETTMEFLSPLFLQLLRDDFHEVRLNIISKLDKVSAVIGIELLSKSLLPAIVKLAEDKQWRVRLAIIEHVPLLAKQFGVDFFNEKLIKLCFDWLCDPVFAIREAATINLKNLIVVFGNDWAVTHVIPKILEMSKSENYLYRLTVIFSVTTVASSLGCDTVRTALLPIVKGLAADPIPNVRFNVAKSLQVLTRIFQEQHQESVLTDVIRPILQALQQDKDQDVRYFSGRALEATTAMVMS